MLVGSSVWWCVHTGADELIFPSIGLIVSLHFAPLAHLFYVRAYYFTAIAGVIITLSAFAGLTSIHHFAFGAAMASVMWLSGWYILRNADQITAKAVGEKWAGWM